jgi:hypothetical protein
MLVAAFRSVAMQAPQDSSPDLVPLICGILSGFLLAGMLLASGLARLSLAMPQLIGAGEGPEPRVERTTRP